MHELHKADKTGQMKLTSSDTVISCTGVDFLTVQKVMSSAPESKYQNRKKNTPATGGIPVNEGVGLDRFTGNRLMPVYSRSRTLLARRITAAIAIAFAATPVSVLAQAPDSGPACQSTGNACSITYFAGTVGDGSTGASPPPILSSFVTPQVWSLIQLTTVAGIGGNSSGSHSNGGNGGVGSEIMATIGSGVTVEGSGSSNLVRLISIGGEGAGAQSGVSPGTAGFGGVGGPVTLIMDGAVLSSDPTETGINLLSQGGTVWPGGSGSDFNYPAESNYAGGSGLVNATIGGSISTVGTAATIEGLGGVGVKGADDNAGISGAAGSAGGDGGSSVSLVQATFTGQIISLAGDGIDVLGWGGAGGQGGLAQGASSADAGGAGGDGGTGAPVLLTLASGSTVTVGGVFGALAESLGGMGGAGNTGTAGGSEGDGASGGNGGNGGNSSSATLVANGKVVGGTNVVSAISGGGAGGTGAGGSASTATGGNGGIGGNGSDATVTIGHDPQGIFNSSLPFPATGVSAISYGGAGGAGASATGTLYAQGGSGGAGGSAGRATVILTSNSIVGTEGVADNPQSSTSVAPGVLVRSNGGIGGAGAPGAALGALAGGSGKGGNGNTATAIINGSISTSGSAAYGLLAQSIGGAGATGGDASGIFASRGGAAHNGGAGGLVYVSGTGGSITTTGTNALGILAQSVGGGGGSGGNANSLGNLAVGGNGGAGGDGDAVTVGYSSNDSNSAKFSNIVTTYGDGSSGIVAQSVGDGGGNGGNAFAAGTGAPTLAIGGDGSGGGSGSWVLVQNDGLVTTFGQQSGGIAAQSIGGGGGNGGTAVAINGSAQISTSFALGGSGGSGQSGGAVTITNNTQISTYGADSYGIKAQSISGGGGQGGSALSTAIALGGDPDVPTTSVSLSIGGNGGAGGDQTSSPVMVNNNGLVTTAGDGAVGVIVQNIAGGGGNGGDSTASSYASGGDGSTNISASSAVGGKGNTGGQGGLATFNGNGGLIATMGADAYGVFAQSVAGGGGIGGAGDSSASSGDGDSSYNGTISVGGSGGAGGSGGTVLVSNDGSTSQTGKGTNIVTSGDGANAIFAQSIGGGGGASGGGTAKAKGGDLNLSVGVGGDAGAGATGGQVTVNNTGILLTTGAEADAIFAQSVGGSGGKAGKGASSIGGTVDTQTQTNNIATALANGLGFGSAYATQLGDGVIQISSAVWNSISTVAQLENVFGSSASYGAASLRTDDDDDDDADNLTLNASIGGQGGVGGTGSLVSVTNKNVIQTQGTKSDGIFAQSIGGGGGVGGASSFSGAYGDVSAGMTLGGSGVSGGNGGEVNITNEGTIRTTGVASYGIDAQSVGGGGGKGAVTGAQNGALKDLTITVGGSGGAGGDGDLVTVTHDGLISTGGHASFGILAQSVGGGGGSAHALSSDINVDTNGDTLGLNVTLGGSGGASGNGGSVNVNIGDTAPGVILTTGADNIGVVAQSIGAGGGTLTATSATDGATGGIQQVTLIPLTIGSLSDTQGASGNGGDVTVNLGVNLYPTDSYIYTRGANAYGIFAQSVGGGGGLFIGATPANKLADLFGTATLQGNGGAVNVNLNNTGFVSTEGAGAVGIFAQSVGGGGGVIGGMQNVDLVSGIQQTPNSESGQGGNVSVSLGSNTSIVTKGAGAHGIFAQAVGGGGGVVAGADNTGYAFSAKDPYGGCGTGACTGNVNVTLSGNSIVRTSGSGAYGIYAQSHGNGTNDTSITVNAGSSLQSWSDSAGAIYVDGQGTNTISNFGIIDDGTLTNNNTPSANGIIVASATPVNYTNETGSSSSGNMKLAEGSTINGLPASTLSATSLDLGGSRSRFTNGGILEAGGKSISSLYINGNYVQQATGQLLVDSDHVAGRSDLVRITGDAALGGQLVMRPIRLTSSTVRVLDVEGELDASELQVKNPYLVNYALSTDSSPAGAGADHSTVKSVYVTPHANFSSGANGLSKNAQAVANHLQANFDTGTGGNALGTAFAKLANGTKDRAGYASTLNRLGNETQQSVGNVSLAASHAFVERMYSCPGFDGPVSAMMHEHDCSWGRIIGNHTSSSNGDSIGYTANTYAMQFGAQHEVDDGLFVGGSFGYFTSNLDGSDGVGSIDGEGPQLGVVVKKEINNWTFSGGADAGYARFDSNRNVTFPGYAAQANAKFNTYEAGLHSRTAYTIPFSDFYVKPYLDLHLVHFHSENYVEHGADALDLAVGSADATTFSTSPMVEVGGRWSFANGMVLRPELAIGAVYHSRDRWHSDANFVGSAPGVSQFSSESTAPQTLAKTKVALNLSISKTTEFKVEYGSQYGRGYNSNEGIFRVTHFF